MPSSPHWKLRRFASRAKRIQARRAAESGAIAAFAATLVPAADAYIAAYSAAARFEAGWKRETAEGKGAVSGLVKVMRSWLPRVTADIHGFAASSFADKPDVPDDVLEDAERLVEVIDEHKDAAGNPLPYRQAALAELDPVLKAAQKEWSEADGADVAYQKLLADVRKAAAAFDPELQAFRRTLAGAFGRRDRDYQKLRAERAATPDEDDDGAPPAQAHRRERPDPSQTRAPPQNRSAPRRTGARPPQTGARPPEAGARRPPSRARAAGGHRGAPVLAVPGAAPLRSLSSPNPCWPPPSRSAPARSSRIPPAARSSCLTSCPFSALGRAVLASR